MESNKNSKSMIGAAGDLADEKKTGAYGVDESGAIMQPNLLLAPISFSLAF
jgi:hypothetical protein